MKIALLNLPIDNNYGGNLQRYALMKVLQDMGHNVVHINLRMKYTIPFPKLFLRCCKRLMLFLLGKKVDFFYERNMRKKQIEDGSYVEVFYSRYIPHTQEVNSIKDFKLLDWRNYDAIVVGSDQVWRYEMAEYSIGLKNFMLSFVEDKTIRKIAYSVSLGVYEDSNIAKYERLKGEYAKFSAVSFREANAISYAKKIGWVSPTPLLTLDPTLLLAVEDYIKGLGLKHRSSDYIFEYILDETPEKIVILGQICKNQKLPLKKASLTGNDVISIDNWVESIMNADTVITDSYHGVVFSILFKKNLYFLGNIRRGNDRILSLFNILHISLENGHVFYNEDTWQKLCEMKYISMKFLKESLYE